MELGLEQLIIHQIYTQRSLLLRDLRYWSLFCGWFKMVLQFVSDSLERGGMDSPTKPNKDYEGPEGP